MSGLGLAFMAADAPEAEATGGLCRGEDECSFKKPNFMLVLDYSTSMNNAFGSSTTQSRWDAAVDAINQLVTFQNGFFDENSHVALLRFGHDPNPGSPGTTITQDVNSGTPAPLVDGFSLDVGWYDPADLANNPWLECNGAAITSALAALPAGGPAGGGSGIGTWTKNALDQAQSLIQTADADHPTDGGIGINTGRYYGIIVITDGAWTGPDGINQSPAEDPNQTADDLFNNDNVPTYVVAVDLAGVGLMEADELSAAGGTTEAVEATSPADLITALQQIVVDVQNAVLIPECTAGLPRVMIILDASSSMLNINQGTVNPPLGEAGGAGQTGWD